MTTRTGDARSDLDPATCYRALESRDPRFDGRFFSGVLSTGIYCRPICPAPTPHRENVRFFPSAAAAGAAGLRPCLRCRPEAAPRTPAWSGTAATVARALRLIEAGALDEHGVERLAERLGMGPRHLRRLFYRHVGTTPTMVARTRRLHFAKRLLDETDLPISEVALAAGFGSLRSFNEAFLAAYRRRPSALRQTARRRPPAADGVVLRLAYRPPYDWSALVEFLARRAVPGLEEVTGESYRRTVGDADSPGRICVRHRPDAGALVVRIATLRPTKLPSLVDRVRRMFDLDADPLAIRSHLERDPALAPLLEAAPGLRLPGAWDGFELAVRAILGQQVSVAAARTLATRLVERLGETLPGASPNRLFPSPQAIAGADLGDLGVPRSRQRALRSLATARLRGEVSFAPGTPPDHLVGRLLELPGVGPWTAEYVALRALGEPDAFPAADLVLRQALANGAGLPPAREVERRAAAWRPWRAYAALHLWRAAATPGS